MTFALHEDFASNLSSVVVRTSGRILTPWAMLSCSSGHVTGVDLCELLSSWSFSRTVPEEVSVKRFHGIYSLK